MSRHIDARLRRAGELLLAGASVLLGACTGEAVAAAGLVTVFDSTSSDTVVATTTGAIADPMRRTLVDEVRIAPTADDTTLFGNVIDEPDLARYDPRHHFDTALIPHGWTHVLGWLRSYRNKPLTDAVGIRCVCWAAHAIGDFYAHSTYAHFLEREGKGLLPYDPETGRPALAFDYASDPDFERASLSYYLPWWNPSHFDRFARWRGHAISGRYSLKGDAHGVVEKLVNLAPAAAFPTPAARSLAGSLPHHDEIAVDEEHGGDGAHGRRDCRWRATAIRGVSGACARRTALATRRPRHRRPGPLRSRG